MPAAKPTSRALLRSGWMVAAVAAPAIAVAISAPSSPAGATMLG